MWELYIRQSFAVFFSSKSHSVEAGKSPFCGLIYKHRFQLRQVLAKSYGTKFCKLASFCQDSALQIVVKQAWCVADFSFIVCNLVVILSHSGSSQTSASALIVFPVLKGGQSLPQGLWAEPRLMIGFVTGGMRLLVIFQWLVHDIMLPLGPSLTPHGCYRSSWKAASASARNLWEMNVSGPMSAY